MRNFLFGRGARCGLCSRVGAVGQAINPFSPAPGTTAGRGCGLFNQNPMAAAPAYAPQGVYTPVPGYAPAAMAGGCNVCPSQSFVGGQSLGGDCGCTNGGYVGGGYVDGGYAAGMAGDCGCGDSCGGHIEGSVYGGSYGGVVDPYLGSGVIGDSTSYGGGYMGETVVPNGVIQGDNFQARKVDAQGNVIISEDPLPPGARLLN